MKASIVEFVNSVPAASLDSSIAYKTDLEKLAPAVAENAMLNTEVDRRITANLLQARKEIVSMKEEVESLRRQFENLTRGMGHVLEATRERR